MHQCSNTISSLVSWYCVSSFKIVDEYYVMCNPSHSIAHWRNSLCTSTSLYPLFWLFLYLWRMFHRQLWIIEIHQDGPETTPDTHSKCSLFHIFDWSWVNNGIHLAKSFFISSVVMSFGLPECSTSAVFVRPQQKSAHHL